jgi:hypothetical protein
MPSEREYSFEALAEVTNTDPEIGRERLNAALRDIRAQEPALASIENSYLLGAEIHERAKMYRRVFEDTALTPNALSKHWLRVKEEASKKKRGGTNLHAADPEPSKYPPSRREENLAEARKILAMLNHEGQDAPQPQAPHE